MAALPVSLKDLVRQSIFDELRKKAIPYATSVLLVDEAADAILLESNCSLTELMGLGIREKQLLFANRNQKDAPVVYFVSPGMDVAQKIVEDAARKLYTSAYIFVTSQASDDVFNYVSDKLPQGYVKCFVEMANIEWSPLESRVFITNEPDALVDLYASSSHQELDTHISNFAKKFRSILCAMNIDPIIRYHDPNDTQKTLSARFAHKLKLEMDYYKESNPNYPAPTAHDHLGAATVIVVDRAYDLLTPLVHTLSFQAAAHDLCHIEAMVQESQGIKSLVFKLDGVNEYPVLDESSPLFNSLRHMFIVQAIEYIKSHIKQLKESESSVAVGIADLRDKVYQVNDILAQKPQVSAVERLLTEIVDIVQRARNLMEVVQVEQDLAVGGRGVDGVALSRKKMIAKVKEVLESLRELLDNEEDKLRLLLLFLLSYGQVASDDFEDLLRSADLQDAPQPLFKGLKFFGVDPSEAPTVSSDQPTQVTSNWNIRKLFGGQQQTNSEVGDSHYDRYQPKLGSLLNDHLTKKLNPAVFRTVKGASVVTPTIARNMNQTIRRGDLMAPNGTVRAGEGVVLDFQETSFRPKWGRARAKAPGDLGGDYRENGPRTVVIVLGGLSYAEVRAAYVEGVKAERDVYVGSTHMLSAKELMDAMIDFGSGSAVPLNVLEAPIIISRGGDGNPATASNPNLTTQQPLNPYPLTSAMSVPIITGGMYESVSTESLNVSSESTPPTVPLKSDYPRPPPRTVYPASSTGTFTAKPYEGHTPSITSTYSSSPSPYGPPPSLTTPQQTANLTAQPYTPTPLAFNATTTSYPSPPTLEHLAAVSADLKKTTASPTGPPAEAGVVLEGFVPILPRTESRAHAPVAVFSPEQEAASLAPVVAEVEAAAIQPTYAQEQRAAREKQRREEEEARKREEEAARLANEAATREQEEQRAREEEEQAMQQRVRDEQARAEEEESRRREAQEEEARRLQEDLIRMTTPSSLRATSPVPSIQSTHSHQSHHSTSTTPPITGPPPSYTHPAPQPQPRPQNPPQTQVDTLIGVSSLYVGFDAQVESLVDMFPHFPRRVLEADLRASGSVEVTTERIVMGLVTPDSYPGYGVGGFGGGSGGGGGGGGVGNRLSGGGGGGGRPASVHSTNSGGGRPVSVHSTNSVGGGVYQSGLGRNGSGGSTYTQDGRTARPVSMIGTPPPPPVVNHVTDSTAGTGGYSAGGYTHSNSVGPGGVGAIHQQMFPISAQQAAAIGLAPAPPGMQYVIYNNQYYLQRMPGAAPAPAPSSYAGSYTTPSPYAQYTSGYSSATNYNHVPTPAPYTPAAPPSSNANRYSQPPPTHQQPSYQQSPSRQQQQPQPQPQPQSPRIADTMVLERPSSSTPVPTARPVSSLNTSRPKSALFSTPPPTTSSSTSTSPSGAGGSSTTTEVTGPPYPLRLQNGVVLDPVPTWTGGWPIVLTTQTVAYQRARKAFVSLYQSGGWTG